MYRTTGVRVTYLLTGCVDIKGFNDLIAHQFEGHSGYWMVHRLEYTLEETCSGKRINRKFPLKSAIRRGMRLEMNMIFKDIDVTSRCPRCNTRAEMKPGILVQWCVELGFHPVLGMSFLLTVKTFEANGNTVACGSECARTMMA